MFTADDMYANSYFMKQNNIPPEDMTEEQRLLYKIIRNYDRSSRPVFHSTTPVVIRLGISLTQVLDVVSRVNNIFFLYIFMTRITDLVFNQWVLHLARKQLSTIIH